MAPCDLCIITLPKSLFVQLSDEAAKRNMTFSQFLAAAIDSYLAPSPAQVPLPPPHREVVVEERSNFEFIPAPKPCAVAPIGTKRLRRFE